MIWLDAIDQARTIRRKEVSSLELTSAFTDEWEHLGGRQESIRWPPMARVSARLDERSPIVEMRGS